MHNRTYDEAAAQWIEDFREFKPRKDCKYFWDWDGPPPEDGWYMPAFKPGTATGWVVYENVTEGTPVSPVFASAQELVEHLTKYGDRWDEERGEGGWSRKSATDFVMSEGYRTTAMVSNKGVIMARDMGDK